MVVLEAVEQEQEQGIILLAVIPEQDPEAEVVDLEQEVAPGEAVPEEAVPEEAVPEEVVQEEVVQEEVVQEELRLEEAVPAVVRQEGMVRNLQMLINVE